MTTGCVSPRHGVAIDLRRNYEPSKCLNRSSEVMMHTKVSQFSAVATNVEMPSKSDDASISLEAWDKAINSISTHMSEFPHAFVASNKFYDQIQHRMLSVFDAAVAAEKVCDVGIVGDDPSIQQIIDHVRHGIIKQGGPGLQRYANGGGGVYYLCENNRRCAVGLLFNNTELRVITQKGLNSSSFKGVMEECGDKLRPFFRKYEDIIRGIQKLHDSCTEHTIRSHQDFTPMFVGSLDRLAAQYRSRGYLGPATVSYALLDCAPPYEVVDDKPISYCNPCSEIPAFFKPSGIAKLYFEEAPKQFKMNKPPLLAKQLVHA